MHYLVTFAVLTCVVATSFSRPAEFNEPVDGDQEDMEYESEEESAVDDSLREDDGSRLDKQDPTYAEQEEEAVQRPMNTEGKRDAPSLSDRHSSKEKCDNSPDYKIHSDRESEDMKPNDYQPQPLQQRLSNYFQSKEANEQTEMSQHLENREIDKRENTARRAAYNRRNTKTTIEDKGDELFENAVPKERIKKYNHQSNNDAPIDPDHAEFFKNYYKTIQTTDEKGKLEDKNYDNFPSNVYRDRRQAQDSGSLVNAADVNVKDNLKNTAYENEETAIKRHIKKLSDQELEGLLNSLPGEKRALLNKIIESEKGHYDGVNKRDITKKAGAVEENIDVDNGVFDSNKVHGSSVDIKNDVGSHIDTTENTKPSEYKTDISEVSSPKKPISQELTHEKDTNVLEENKSNANLNDVFNNAETKSQAESNGPLSKLNSKRETSLNDLKNECSTFGNIHNNNFNLNGLNENANDNAEFNFQNEDLSQLIGNEAQQGNNNIDHANKREALLENTDSFKSLEESFPNSNTYKESGEYSEIDMVPLVRVKRRNNGSFSIKKRNAKLVPDTKVAYIPYRAENDDDDSEEGNEFEDDGFYERTSNYAKDIDSQLSDDMSAKKIHSKSETDISRNENIETDTMNIGSDSDSVLSGVEGVDDNLMYNSGARNRRTAEIKPADSVNKNSEISSLIDFESKTQTDNLNTVNYQENDAFGPLPRNYEGELSRLKRIRRVKPACNSASSDNNK